MSWMFANEPVLRLSAFAGVFALMVVWELARPRRKWSASKRRRWFTNLSIVVLDTVLLRLVFPLAAVGIALMAEERDWGLLNNVAIPSWLAVVVGVLLLDLTIYLQHLMFHAVPAFWRIHRMHHADLDFDVTTALRFHPIEILLSMLIKFAAVAAFGAPALAVLLFEVILNACAMFNHSNVHLPERVDRILRKVLVTPDMHRVHHSTSPSEHNRNFGFNLSWWDRLLGTYTAQPRDGHESMQIGLSEPRDERPTRFWWLMAYPFLSGDTGSSLEQHRDDRD